MGGSARAAATAAARAAAALLLLLLSTPALAQLNWPPPAGACVNTVGTTGFLKSLANCNGGAQRTPPGGFPNLCFPDCSLSGYEDLSVADTWYWNTTTVCTGVCGCATDPTKGGCYGVGPGNTITATCSNGAWIYNIPAGCKQVCNKGLPTTIHPSLWTGCDKTYPVNTICSPTCASALGANWTGSPFVQCGAGGGFMAAQGRCWPTGTGSLTVAALPAATTGTAYSIACPAGQIITSVSFYVESAATVTGVGPVVCTGNTSSIGSTAGAATGTLTPAASTAGGFVGIATAGTVDVSLNTVSLIKPYTATSVTVGDPALTLTPATLCPQGTAVNGIFGQYATGGNALSIGYTCGGVAAVCRGMPTLVVANAQPWLAACRDSPAGTVCTAVCNTGRTGAPRVLCQANGAWATTNSGTACK